MWRQGCSSLEPVPVRVAVRSVGEGQERILQSGGLAPDVLGDQSGAVESEDNGGDEVAFSFPPFRET